MSKIQVNPFRNPIASSNLIDYAHYTGLHFRDSISGDLCWIYGDTGGNNTYLVTQTAQDVAPTLVATVTNSYMTMVSSAQDASGYLHFLCYYSYGLSHAKGTLTRSGGHVTGLSLSAAISLPTMTSSLGGAVWAGTIAVINNGSAAERVMIMCVDGSDATQYAGALCHSSTSPTATSDFLSLAGTASTWTKLPTQTCSANVGAAYCFNAAIEQYGSSGHFFADCGAASRGDVGNYSTALTGYRCTASSTTWTVDTANPCVLATETDESLCGHSCKDASGNAYFAWTQRTGSATVTVGLSKVAADGTFTASWVSTTTSSGGEIRAFPAVCSDGTVILALGIGDTGSSTTQYEIKAYSGGSWYTYLSASTRWVLATDLNWIDRGSRGWRDGLVLSIGASAYPATVSIGSVALRSTSAGNVYYDNYSLPAYSAAGGTSVTPAYASAVPHATRDMHVCVVGQKPSTANSGTITFPSGWTQRGAIAAAGGYGATLGVDTGNVNCAIATKDSVDGAESGTISVTLATSNIAWSMMARVTKAGDGDWGFASTTGSDVTAGAALSVVYDSAVDLAPGDLVVIGWCQPTDVTTPKQFTAQALAASGITFSEVTVLAEPDSDVGNDIGGWVGFARVLAGTGSVTPTFSATASGTTTNVRGGSVLLRLREVSGAGANTVEGTESPAAPMQTTTLLQASTVVGTEQPAAPAQIATLLQASIVAGAQAPAAPTETATIAGSNAVVASESPAAATETTALSQISVVTATESPAAPSETSTILQPAFVAMSESPTEPSEMTAVWQQLVTAVESPAAPSETEILFQGSNVAATESPSAPAESTTISQYGVAGVEAPSAPVETGTLLQVSTVTATEVPAQPLESAALLQTSTVVASEETAAPVETANVYQVSIVATVESPTEPIETANVVQGAHVATTESPAQSSQTTTLAQPSHVTLTESPAAPTETTALLQVSAVAMVESPSQPIELGALQQGSLVVATQEPSSALQGATLLQSSVVSCTESPVAPAATAQLFATSRVDAIQIPAQSIETATLLTYQPSSVYCVQSTPQPVESCAITTIGVGPRVLYGGHGSRFTGTITAGVSERS